MSGFMSSDGSALVGGRLPNGQGVALNLDAAGSLLVSSGGAASVAIAAGTTGNTVVKASPGRLARILVTATGTGALSIYDNASGPTGTIIAIVPSNATVGTLLDCQAPAANGITVAGNSNNPGVTVFYY